MTLMDTPPSSPSVDVEMDEDELVYVGDADEVIEALERDERTEDSEEEAESYEEQPIKDDAAYVFRNHEGSIFCGALNKDGTLAATGGEDDKAYVWEVSSGRVVLNCTGHSDSVTFTEFNHDGFYLATADMNGIIQVWKMSNRILIWDYNMGDMTWMRWHPMANILFAGASSGVLYMWKIPSGECKIFQSHGQRVEQGVIMRDGKRITVGYEDGTLRVFDLKSGAVLSTISCEFGHSSTITALDCNSDNNLLISGGMDGKTILTTSQSGKVTRVLQDLKTNVSAGGDEDAEGNEGNWVEAVSFCKDPEYPVAVSGTVNGQIFIWDIAKQMIRHEIQQSSGISKLVWHLNTTRFYSSGLDGVVRSFDARSGEELRSYMGHHADILDLVISRDGKTMLTTSDDSTARIFNIGDPN
ncbi:angio-associated migratory cell protein isoform X1 [Neodiprion fabricii]|uniref:angio-associated migratory cell protein isoform X1 n=1 Tax=Neodiprion fabricii TaxID=2872261 RepID=UPI001ED8EFEE|nr:angio-associated migratory cell protein isoform X1 [Neodiprion fabricii]